MFFLILHTKQNKDILSMVEKNCERKRQRRKKGEERMETDRKRKVFIKATMGSHKI